MANHDYNIANQTASAARTDINNALAAIVSNNSGSSEPTTTFANMWWYDTANNILKFRNEADTAWIEIGELNQTSNTFNGGVPAGAVSAFAMSTTPNGWLQCDGAAVSRTTYANLFAAIGTDYGVGDGATTFNLPDLRGEFIRGWDDSRGIDSGRTMGSTQTDLVKSHDHHINYNGAFGGNSTNRANDPRWSWGDTSTSNTTNNAKTLTTGPTAGVMGTETRPRNIALNYCIKY